MKKITVGQRLYVSVMTVFLLFAISFIVFQQYREKQYKIDTLNLKLQEYNDRMAEAMRSCPSVNESWLTHYVGQHPVRGIRVTLITVRGRVVYDNVRKDYAIWVIMPIVKRWLRRYILVMGLPSIECRLP
ncbi:hypothetical protein [Segatella albensis]|uniref:hypothetical protein n=1 Tax=Segatella albensis TaxID=77768 RepID=UPI00278BDA1D|nr:hypothetical protein [Segatella albensis]